jgi:tetratricopeptide (TPR) repeat protein
MVARTPRGTRTDLDRVTQRGQEPTVRNEPYKAVLGLALLLATTFVAYVPAMRSGYVYDDPDYVVKNETLRSVQGLRNIWLLPSASPQYYPLTFTAFWMEFHLWGADPFGYHVVNVAIHALNAVLLWLLLYRLDVPGAFLAAALFALHPVHVESVAWVTERKDVLCAAFYLLTLLVWLRFVATRRWRHYLLALALFASAMLSKTVACTLPVTLLLLGWWREPATWRRQIWLVVPFLMIGAGLPLITIWREHLGGDVHTAMRDLSPTARVLVAGRAFWFYGWKLIWPVHLMNFYPHWTIDPTAPLQYAVPAAVIGVLILLWVTRRRLGVAPLVAAVFFGVTLAPVSGLLDFDFLRFSYVADHFQYLASGGLIALFAAGVSRAGSRLGALGRRIIAVAAGMILGTFALLVWRQAHVYKDTDTFWRTNCARNPKLVLVLNNIGQAMVREGQVAKAIPYFSEAVILDPNYLEAHVNLAGALSEEGKVAQAIQLYTRALRIDPRQAEIENSLGAALVREGKLAEAISHFQSALRIEPANATAHYNLGAAIALEGKPDDASREFAMALQIKPDFAEAHYYWGTLLQDAGKFDEAIAHYSAALESRPDFVAAQKNIERARAQREAANSPSSK